MYSLHPFSATCTEALNRVVAYHLHTSHVYLAVTYNFITDKERLPFVSYFGTLAETRRDYANKFLKQLWARNKKICPPTFKMVDLKEINTPIKALLLAQEMESTLTCILLGLKTSARYESDLLKFVTSLLHNQRGTEDYMKEQLTQQQKIERDKEREARVGRRSTLSGQEELRRRSKRSKLELMKPGA